MTTTAVMLSNIMPIKLSQAKDEPVRSAQSQQQNVHGSNQAERQHTECPETQPTDTTDNLTTPANHSEKILRGGNFEEALKKHLGINDSGSDKPQKANSDSQDHQAVSIEIVSPDLPLTHTPPTAFISFKTASAIAKQRRKPTDEQPTKANPLEHPKAAKAADSTTAFSPLRKTAAPITPQASDTAPKTHVQTDSPSSEKRQVTEKITTIDQTQKSPKIAENSPAKSERTAEPAAKVADSKSAETPITPDWLPRKTTNENQPLERAARFLSFTPKNNPPLQNNAADQELSTDLNKSFSNTLRQNTDKRLIAEPVTGDSKTPMTVDIKEE